MLLAGKSAILYGAGGQIGGAVARAFARDGARLFLAGRTEAPLAALAAELRSAGGTVDHDIVDATDPDSVRTHFDTVIDRAGGVDIAFNMISIDDRQGIPLTDMALDDYLTPVTLGARTHFVTATVAARHMVERGRGVILAITATPARLALPLVGGFGAACAAIEAMLRTLAAEIGPKGVRVAWLRSAGSPESFGEEGAVDPDGNPAGLSDDGYLETLRQTMLLRRFPTLSEVGDAASLIASDRASAITGAAMNITCGQIAD